MPNWIKTTKGVFLPSERDDVYPALAAYCPGKSFLDGGSGNGFVVTLAAEAGAVNPRGIEYDEFFPGTETPLATDIIGDMMTHDISQYQVLFYYVLGCKAEKALLEKVRDEFTGVFLWNGRHGPHRFPHMILGRDPVETLGMTKIFDLGEQS